MRAQNVSCPGLTSYTPDSSCPPARSMKNIGVIHKAIFVDHSRPPLCDYPHCSIQIETDLDVDLYSRCFTAMGMGWFEFPCLYCFHCLLVQAHTCRPCKLERCRSEEHTSELQSRQYLVCRLLL